MNIDLNFFLTIVIVAISVFILFKFLSGSLIKEIKALFILIVHGKKTTGYVRFVEEKTHTEGSIVYSAVIEFKTERSEPVFFKTPFDFMAKPDIGSRVNLIYNPNDPTIARAYNLGTFLVPVFSLLSIVLGIAAIIFAIIKLEILKQT